jgi:hypothetical protein
MRTLKTFIIAASLFLFTIPALAANYPPEMPDIKNAPMQFTCETTSSLFIKTYLNLDNKWQVIITGRNKQEMLMDIISRGKRNIFALIPSSNNAWREIHALSEAEMEELEKILGPIPTEEDSQTLQTCVKSNLRSRGLLQ